jgi:hypothetical protein
MGSGQRRANSIPKDYHRSFAGEDRLKKTGKRYILIMLLIY